MPSKLILKKSSTTGSVPAVGDLDYGELAINYTDKKVYFKTNANQIEPLGQTKTNTITSAATITPNSDITDTYEVTALAVAATVAQPSGTPVNNQKLLLKIKDNGTAQTITWDAQYRAVNLTLPTTTVANKVLYVGCIYNATDSYWDVLAVGQS